VTSQLQGEQFFCQTHYDEAIGIVEELMAEMLANGTIEVHGVDERGNILYRGV
jgi:hypothetical protein